MSDYTYKITVFTPTYNRAYIIETLYKSLQRQTYTNFEWLVIDDGSNDNTENIFQKWIHDNNPFPIRYVKQSNGGKCRALNHALTLAQGELFFTVDSDDYLTDDALEKIVSWERELPQSEKYCGIAGNLGTSINDTPNRLFANQFYDGTLLDRYKNVNGERAIVLYTDIHRKYQYPEFDDEKFMTEAVVWNRIAHDGYKIRFYNDIIWIYEYKDDGLTKAGNIIFVNNPRGYGLWLREKADFEKISVIQKLKLCYAFVCELDRQYEVSLIADCIGTSRLLITFLKFVHNIKYRIKGKRV